MVLDWNFVLQVINVQAGSTLAFDRIVSKSERYFVCLCCVVCVAAAADSRCATADHPYAFDRIISKSESWVLGATLLAAAAGLSTAGL
jgi:hypothetical protein